MRHPSLQSLDLSRSALGRQPLQQQAQQVRWGWREGGEGGGVCVKGRSVCRKGLLGSLGWQWAGWRGGGGGRELSSCTEQQQAMHVGPR
jgi:hypothetical protein